MSRLASWLSDLERENVTNGAMKKYTPVERLIVTERTNRAHTIDEDITSKLHGRVVAGRYIQFTLRTSNRPPWSFSCTEDDEVTQELGTGKVLQSFFSDKTSTLILALAGQGLSHNRKVKIFFAKCFFFLGTRSGLVPVSEKNALLVFVSRLLAGFLNSSALKHCRCPDKYIPFSSTSWSWIE